jgi:hypothetical protein
MTSNTIAWWSHGLLVAIADMAPDVRLVRCNVCATSEVQRGRGVIA